MKNDVRTTGGSDRWPSTTTSTFQKSLVLLMLLPLMMNHHHHHHHCHVGMIVGVHTVLAFPTPSITSRAVTSTASTAQCHSHHHYYFKRRQPAWNHHRRRLTVEMKMNESKEPTPPTNDIAFKDVIIRNPTTTTNNNNWLLFTKTVISILLVGIVSVVSLASPVSAVMDDTTTRSTSIEQSTTIHNNNNNNNDKHVHPHDNRYYSIQTFGTEEERIQANLKLLDYIIGSINTMYYDVTGGTNFDPRNFYIMSQQYIHERTMQNPKLLATRDGVVSVIHGLLNDVLQDPYSSYLTREELRAELRSSSLPSSSLQQKEQKTLNERYQQELGIIVKDATMDANQFLFGPAFTIPTVPIIDSLTWFQTHHLHQPVSSLTSLSLSSSAATTQLSPMEGYRLPVIVAVSPNSLGERLGLTVGDRIISPASNNIQTPSRESSHTIMDSDMTFVTVAKPIYDVPFTRMETSEVELDDIDASFISTENTEGSTHRMATASSTDSNNHIRGYRPIRVRIPTLTDVDSLSGESNPNVASKTSGGNAYVHYEVLSSTNSIFQKNYPITNTCRDASHCNNDVGYIRLTRFSRASTKGFMDAVQTLEGMGIRRYIIDVRNNYGGVIQEAMLCAATLLRDPHMVLCYTMNSRGGLTPHDVEEYVMDQRYPGYWLSRESHDTTKLQVQREHPSWFRPSSTDEWLPMSSFASLHEQHVKRGIKLSFAASNPRSVTYSLPLKELQQLAAQKDIAILINEGTASSAEVFASSLHDNGRTVALVGSKTYGKGLVQHTFPTPDGGGLRLTVVEYLTPALHHVTHVGGAQYDRQTGAYIGGGIQPDVVCDSIHGIPNHVGSDLCVGVAIDALNEADHAYQSTGQLSVKRVGGIDDGSKARRAVTIGILKDDF